MLKHLRYLLLAMAMLLLISCGNTKNLAIGIVEPAPVELPHAVKRIGVVNNTRHFERKEQSLKSLEEHISRDDEFLTQKGVESALDGLLKQLLQDPRFDTIINLSGTNEILQIEGGEVTNGSWQAIRSFCERHDLDAIFSLDYYQASTKFSLRKAKMFQRDLIRVAVAEKGHQLTLETLIENGWKIYDPFQKTILDEYVLKDQITANAMGTTPLRAYQNIGSLQDSLVIKSRNTGGVYGSRLQPIKRTIYRKYYSRGTDGFIEAHNKIKAGDWEGAMALWKEELASNKRKQQAMASHNLAVVHEYLENLKEARYWAKKAHDHKKSKKALSYIEELDNRITQNQQVQEQLAQLGR